MQTECIFVNLDKLRLFRRKGSSLFLEEEIAWISCIDNCIHILFAKIAQKLIYLLHFYYQFKYRSHCVKNLCLFANPKLNQNAIKT